MQEKIVEIETITETVDRIIREVKLWPEHKKVFIGLENDNTFTKIELGE